MALWIARDHDAGNEWRSRYFVRLRISKTLPIIDNAGCYPLGGILILRNQAPPIEPGECVKVKLVRDDNNEQGGNSDERE